jgi:hypothetical protein
MDVLALERRDEGTVQPLEGFVRDAVRLVLDVLDALGPEAQVSRVVEDLG